MCGADSIDDVNVLRASGTPGVFDEVYAPSTLGIFLREFTFGHANQLAAVAREHLVALAQRVPLPPGIRNRAGRRRLPHRAIVGPAVVVTGDAECEQERQHQHPQRNPSREMPQPNAEMAGPRFARCADARRVKRRQIVVVRHPVGATPKCPSGRINDERGKPRSTIGGGNHHRVGAQRALRNRGAGGGKNTRTSRRVFCEVVSVFVEFEVAVPHLSPAAW